MSDVYFASVKVKRLEAEYTLPVKFQRMLDAAGLETVVKGKKVCIKMHLGDKVGYTTIHPFFVRTLVDKLKAYGAKKIFVADGKSSLKGCEERGYTKKTFGCKIVPLFRPTGKKVTVPIGYKTFDEANISKDVLDADVFIDFSHLKAHGSAGFGGAGKNIAMGCCPPETRAKMHALEGGIKWDAEKCTKCEKCIKECPNKANKFNDEGNYEIFWHNCTLCRHCVLSCPNGALENTDVTPRDFQQGMSLVVKYVLDHFGPNNVFFINLLMNITVFCDCWGFSTANLVPDIGILASKDLVAIDKASLDLVQVKDLNPIGLPEGKTLGEGDHLFEKIHAKNPYLMGEVLAETGVGSLEYKIIEIE